MHTYNKIDIPVDDTFIKKFAEKYIEQRSQTLFDYRSINESKLFQNLGFGTEVLKNIITQNTVAVDRKRDAGEQQKAFSDIYRSDLGELLMTYYYEEKLPEGERYVIPLKNITFRERADLPGRGMDTIGYKQVSDTKVEVLLGEAKVSEQKKSPPDVVDKTNDSLYITQKKYKNDKSVVIQRLSDYARRLNAKDANIIGFVILSIHHKLSDNCLITYGCTLIRDHDCVNESSDYGKMKTAEKDFEPGRINFSILSFKEKTIPKTVDLFYKKVQELLSNSQ